MYISLPGCVGWGCKTAPVAAALSQEGEFVAPEIKKFTPEDLVFSPGIYYLFPFYTKVSQVTAKVCEWITIFDRSIVYLAPAASSSDP